MPTFIHSFNPPGVSTVGATLNLSVREIEDAGLREILQIPGAAVGNWKILDALLDSSVSTFSFIEPLGHAREVKTAISGLFGRFVARAYATKHLRLRRFVHIRKPPMRLSGRLRAELRRVRGRRGDMPDWVAWGPRAGFAIVEAKGCHDKKGPDAALARAVTQAERAEIAVPGATVPFKRYAIATRWGFTSPKIMSPMLSVNDPREDGDLTPEQENELAAAMVRWDIATLLAALGHEDLASPIMNLAQQSFANRRTESRQEAKAVLDRAATYRVRSQTGGVDDELIGGFVVRGGPLRNTNLTRAEQDALKRLELAPTFIGVERSVVKLAIGDMDAADVKSSSDRPGDRRPGEDGAGGWVIRLDKDEAQVTLARRRRTRST